MAGMRNVREYAGAFDSGQFRRCSFRKVPSQASVASWWVDLSMAAGNPKPNFYAAEPAVAATLTGFNGILHGDDVSPKQKFLSNIMVCTPTAGLVGNYKLLDYLIYYPFIDLDSTDEQAMDNTVTLPRYTDGDGVRAMMVCAAPTVGGGSFTYNYVDNNGVSRTSPTITCATAVSNIASIVTSEPATAAGGNLFLPMHTESRGVRSITSLTMITPAGGLASLVLVKPIVDFTIFEASVPVEVNFLRQRQPPLIYDDAYLNLVVRCAATVAAGTLTGSMEFVFN